LEIDRRQIYTEAACRSLTAYSVERLGMSEDEARKRVSVARLVGRFPSLLDELRSGAIHLTGLFLLSQQLTEHNFDSLVPAARGRSRHDIEVLLASHAPKPDVPERVAPVPEQTELTGPETATAPAGPGTAPAAAARVKPLSAMRWSVQFTASQELHDKIERARELSSHALPGGELAPLFERALDALIERETKRRLGAGKPRKRRPLKPSSRHVPVDVGREVWERDGGQCTFVDADGNRCSARRFLTLEHKDPYARGGPPTVDNLCLFCKAHNHHAARKVFGEAFIERKRKLARLHSVLWAFGKKKCVTWSESSTLPARRPSSMRSSGWRSKRSSRRHRSAAPRRDRSRRARLSPVTRRF
jgi:hypothetical protein